MLKPIANSRANRWMLALLSPVLLWAAWPAGGFAPLSLVGFLPLLQLQDTTTRLREQGQNIRLFPYVYLSFAAFNALNTWWVWYASPFGMFGMIFANSLLMSIPFMLFDRTRRIFGNTWGYISLPVYWISFEHLHMDWDLSWPWLNLGNVWAAWPNFIQWYEWTGTQGGSLWILAANIFLFRWIMTPLKKSVQHTVLAWVMLFPPLLSWFILQDVETGSAKTEVVVVQPNIDPYNEKFSGNSAEQLERIIGLAEDQITSQTRIVVAPETAIPDGIWDEQLGSHPQLERIRSFLSKHPNIDLLIGLTYIRQYAPNETPSPTARMYPGTAGVRFDVYNAAIRMSAGRPDSMHFKSKLVPGVEKMPFPVIFGHLEEFAINLGGITGSLGTQESPSVFPCGEVLAAPVICYESVFGAYVGEYVRQGANLICIMTNDGWWENTPGYRQHCQYARLRAIEHRSAVARAANTGISCFINPKGELTQATGWWVPASIRTSLELRASTTFYTRHGDWIGRIFTTLGLLGLLPILVIKPKRVALQR
ncbi:MAG: apolipoprotein N-acyltransferase [Bacteroidota bacterium]